MRKYTIVNVVILHFIVHPYFNFVVDIQTVVVLVSIFSLLDAVRLAVVYWH